MTNFKSEEYQNSWRCIMCNTFENMELYYRKQFYMQDLVCYFEEAFSIPWKALTVDRIDSLYEEKLLAIYLLTKYSKEDFKIIADEFNISLETVNSIYTNNTFKTTFMNDVKLFFKQLESDYLNKKQSSLEWKEFYEIPLSRQSNVEKDII